MDLNDILFMVTKEDIERELRVRSSCPATKPCNTCQEAQCLVASYKRDMSEEELESVLMYGGTNGESVDSFFKELLERIKGAILNE